jgi:nitrous oxidase accessory protein NosD
MRRSCMKRVIGVSLALTASLMMIGTAPARAAVTQAVDDDGFASLTNCNAATPANTTIQAGVNAAPPGDTVKVCPGTYTENVTVNKALILNGAKAGVNGTRRPPGQRVDRARP